MSSTALILFKQPGELASIAARLRAALRDDPLVMPDRIIAAYRRRGWAP